MAGFASKKASRSGNIEIYRIKEKEQ